MKKHATDVFPNGETLNIFFHPKIGSKAGMSTLTTYTTHCPEHPSHALKQET